MDSTGKCLLKIKRSSAALRKRLRLAAAAFNKFRWQQTMLGNEVTATDKADLRQRQESLSNELNQYLAAEYGVNVKDPKAYERWRASHPALSLVCGILWDYDQGGFDVVSESALR